MSRGNETDGWAKIYKGYQASGLSQREYCAKNEIKFTQFKAGIQAGRVAGRIKLGGRRKQKAEARRSSGFLAVQVGGTVETVPSVTQRSPTPYCEIRLSGESGIRIETESAMGFWIELMRGLCR